MTLAIYMLDYKHFRKYSKNKEEKHWKFWEGNEKTENYQIIILDMEKS